MLFHATKTPLEERLKSVPPAQSPPASAVPREKGVGTHHQPGMGHGCCSSHQHLPARLLFLGIYKITHSAALLDGGLAQTHGLFGQWARVNVGFPSLACTSNLSCSSAEPRAKSFPSADPSCPADVLQKDQDPPLALCTARKCHPPSPKCSHTSSYSCKQGHPSQWVYLQKEGIRIWP